MTLISSSSPSSSSLLFSSLSRDQEAQWHESIAWNIICLSLPVFLTLHYIIPAPWGKLLLLRSSNSNTASRASSSKSQKLTGVLLRGPRIPARLAWVLFESPNLVWALVAWRHRRRDHEEDEAAAYSSSLQLANYVLYLLFVAHYVQRAIIYPWRMSPHSKPMPLVIVLSGLCYCTFNGYLQCRSLLYFQHFPNHWYQTVQFHVGLVLFAIGARINLQSDGILRNLSRQRLGKQPQQQAPPTSTMSANCTSTRPQHRQQQQKQQYRCNDYQIPTGGWFEYCSTPHYFGEIVQWTGFCIACQYSIASMSFCVFTAANLIPRGVAQHEWYQAHFNGNNNNKKYPAHRKAVIPFLW